jgi:hypothetical protein
MRDLEQRSRGYRRGSNSLGKAIFSQRDGLVGVRERLELEHEGASDLPRGVFFLLRRLHAGM